MKRERLDNLLVAAGLAADVESARRIAMAGKVRIDGQVADKPGHTYAVDADIQVQKPPRFASRGGLKLEAALAGFEIDLAGLVCLDVGASTGGFTDCMLQHGARQVYAVDCGRGQLHARLQRDRRVIVMDNTNARYLAPADFDIAPAFCAIDAAFISLEKLLPAVCEVLAAKGRIIGLVKPQFEARRDQVEPGGVVKDPAVHAEVLKRVQTFAENNLDLAWQGMIQSPVKGPAGNIEFLAYWEKRCDA